MGLHLPNTVKKTTRVAKDWVGKTCLIKDQYAEYTKNYQSSNTEKTTCFKMSTNLSQKNMREWRISMREADPHFQSPQEYKSKPQWDTTLGLLEGLKSNKLAISSQPRSEKAPGRARALSLPQAGPQPLTAEDDSWTPHV